MEERIMYFDRPTQVKFVTHNDIDETEDCYGIAYCDEVICSCCGGIFSLEELYEDADEFGNGENPIETLDWVNFKDAISY